MTPFITRTKFTVSSNKMSARDEAVKNKSKNNFKSTIQKRKRLNQRRPNSLPWSLNTQTSGRRKTKVENGKGFENHSPGTTALTPPVSPPYNLQNGHPSGVSLYYSDAPSESCMDYQPVATNVTTSGGNPSPEAIDDLVSEHFRNCGVNPSSSDREPVEYGDMLHCNEQEHFARCRLENRFTLGHQVRIVRFITKIV